MIEFKNVSKVYKGGKKAAENINLSFDRGEFIVFIGTSGSGKTTSMRMINRMIEHTSGQILINGEDIMKKDPVKLRRKIGYVIQQIGLMPHMTIFDNIVLVPRLMKWPKEKQRQIGQCDAQACKKTLGQKTQTVLSSRQFIGYKGPVRFHGRIVRRVEDPK